MRTADGLMIYDLKPHASELWAIAGPDGWQGRLGEIDTDHLPEGFRWVSDDEWESACQPPAKKLVNSHQILADALADAECDARLILGEARDSLDGTKVRGNWTPGIADEVDEKISIVIGKLIAAKSAIGVYRQISNAIRYQRS